jgi:hypothetical protein
MERAIDEQDPTISSESAARLARRRLKARGWKTSPSLKGLGTMRHGYLSTNRLISNIGPSRRTSYNPTTEIELDTIFAEQIETVWRVYTNRVLSTVTKVQSDGLRDILRSLLFTVLFTTPEPTKESPPEVKQAYERAAHFLQRRPGPQDSTEFLEFQKRFNEEPHFRGVVEDIDQIERRIEQAEEPRRRLAELISSFFSEDKNRKSSQFL